MEDYSVVDKRKHSFVVMDKSIVLAYAPFVGTEAVCLYVLYAALADQGSTSIDQDALKEFLGMEPESLAKCNDALEEYGLVKLENSEHDGSTLTSCYLLQPPPLPQALYTELRKKALTKYVEDVLEFVPAEPPRKKKRPRRSLVTASKLITKLYAGISNGQVDIFERESGKRHINDLLRMGHSLEDIDFAIEWSLENARSEVEDFSSLVNLIDRAIRAKEEYMTTRAQQVEQESKSQGEEERDRKMLEAYRKAMPDSQKKDLRERAMEEIRGDKRINEEFVTEQLIVIKENEIIRKEFLRQA